MAQHRINMTANFSQADAGLKDMISNIRSFGKAAEFAGESGSKSVSKFIKEMSEVDSKAVTTQQRLSAMGTVLKEQEMWYNRMGASAKKAFGQELQASIEEARKKVAQYNAELQGVGAGTSTGGGIGVFGITKGMIAYQALMKTVQLGTQTFQYAINTNMDFEQSNATLAAVLGTTRDKVADLTEQAKKLGASTQYTAGEIVGLQTELARLGFLQSQIKAMTEGVTNLSIATGIDLSRAANIAGSTIRAFNLPASEAERVVSALAVSTTKSALTMETLSTSLPYAASQAKQFGFTLEDTLGLLGTLANAGFKASNQGMAVRNILSAIANDSSKLSRAMGMPIRTLDDFVEGLKKMKAEGANLNDIASIIEVRVGPALSRFVDAADDIKGLRDQLKDCTGEFDAMTAEMKNTAKFAKIEMKSAWDSLMLTFDNSNGNLKRTYEWFTKIINKWIEFRKMRQGGDSAISLFEKGIGTDEAKAAINAGIAKYDNKDLGKALEAAQKGEGAVIDKLDKTIAFATEQMDKYYALRNELDVARRGGDVERADYVMREMEKMRKNFFLRYDGEGSLPITDINKLPEFIGGEKDKRAISQAIIDHFVAQLMEKENAPGAGAGYRDKYSKAETGQLTPSEKYQERIEKALDHYQVALNKASIEYENGMLGEKESNEAKAAYTKKREQAEETLFGAYSDVVAEMRREAADVKTLDSERAKMLMLIEEYLPNIKNEALMSGALAKEYAELKDLIEKAKEEERERQAKERQQRGIYNRALNSIESTARGNNIRYADIGVGGFKELINNNQMTDDLMKGAVDKLNEQLKTKGIRWTVKLDLESGTLEKLKSRLDEVFSGVGKGVGGVKSIVGALDSIKKAGESLKDTLEGDADGWDKMMAVFNAAMAPLEAAVTIYEAINALKEMSAILSGKETAAKIADTVATEAHTVAEGADATASGISAGASAAEGVAKGVKSVSWIPVVGPILAVAAAASIAAAIAAANRKTEYHAGGGFVGMGGPRGTDTVNTWLTPGELVLNRAQQNNLAGQLAPAGGYDVRNFHLETSFEAERVRVMLVNNSKRRGGTGKNFSIQ